MAKKLNIVLSLIFLVLVAQQTQASTPGDDKKSDHGKMRNREWKVETPAL